MKNTSKYNYFHICFSPEGYIKVSEILQHKSFRGKYKTSDIERVVANNDKQRFKLRRNPQTQHLEIKANQGHTVAVSDAELIPILEVRYRSILLFNYQKSNHFCEVINAINLKYRSSDVFCAVWLAFLAILYSK